MKFIKYLIALIAFLAVAICTGEFYQVHVYEAGGGDFVAFSLDTNTDLEDFYKDVQNTADAHEVLAICESINSMGDNSDSKITIYFSDMDSAEEYASDLKIKEGYSQSLFMYGTDVDFEEMRQCREDGDVYITLLGDKADKQAFIDLMGEKYEVNMQSVKDKAENYFSSEAFIVQIVLWIIACAVIAVLALYESMMMQKESAVRCSLGENPFKIYLKKVLLDSAVLVLLFLASFLFSSVFTNSLFAFGISAALFAALLLVNAIALFPIFKVKIDRAFSGAAGSLSMLSASYTLKLITCVLTVLVAAMTIGSVSEVMKIKKQGDFFEQYKDYSYIQMLPKSDSLNAKTPTATVKYRLQKEFFANTLLQTHYTNLLGLSDGVERELILCNKNAKENLLKAIPGLTEEKISEEKMYVITPNYPGYENDTEFAQPDLTGTQGYFFCHEYEVETVPYESDVYLTATNGTADKIGCEVYKNPIILFSNLDESELSIPNDAGTFKGIDEETGVEIWDGGLDSPYYDQFLMFKVTDSEIQEFLDKYNLELSGGTCSKVNVYENFEAEHDRAEKMMGIFLVLFLVLFLLETALISTVIRLDYSVNAKELAIKKVLGYSVFEKNRKIFAITIGVMILGMIAAVVISSVYKIANPFTVAAGCGILAAAEIIIIILNIVKTEKAQIVKILKGGSL